MAPATLAAAAAVDPWEWHPHPDVWLLVAVLIGGYAWAVIGLGPRLARGARVVTGRQVAAYTVGVALVYAFAEWPVHELSEHYLLSVHMVQHVVFSLVAPPLLLMGLPPWLLRHLVGAGPLREGLRRLARPVPATLIFNGVVVLVHLPPWVDATTGNELTHVFSHSILFAAALLMWFPVINRAPGLPSFSLPVSMGYLFAQSIVPTVPASFLTFAERPLYRLYADAPRLFGFSAVEDQQLAGVAMKLGGGVILWIAILVLFFRWYSANERDQGDVLTWADVERELARTRAPVSPN